MAPKIQDIVGFTIFVAFCVLIFVQVVLLISNYESDPKVLLKSELRAPEAFSTIKIPALYDSLNLKIVVIFRNLQAYEISLSDFASRIFNIEFVPDVMDFGSGGFFYQNELYVITSMDPTINLRKLDTTNRVLREIEAFEPLTSFHFYGETALVGDTILISGGLDEHFAFQSRVDAWNITSRSWSLSKKLPNPVESHCYQGIDDKFLILAGGKTSVTEATSETYIYDISNDVYTKIADLPFPWASMSCAIVQTSTDSKTLVMSGGRKMVEIGVFEPVTDTAIFNINYDFTGNWTVIDHKLPFAIEEGTLIGAGPRAFWFGGNVFGPQPYPEQILTFDFQKGWQNFQAHPKIPSSNPVAILYPTT